MRPGPQLIVPILSFGIAGTLAGVLWSVPPNEWGPVWFWTLGPLFAAAVLLAMNFQGSNAISLQPARGHVVLAALILSMAWPIAITSLFFVAKLFQGIHLRPDALAGDLMVLIPILAASLCVSFALRILRGIWDARVFSYLLLSGSAVTGLAAIISSVQKRQPANLLYPFDSGSGTLTFLVISGTTAFAALFGLGLLRASRIHPAEIEHAGQQAASTKLDSVH